MIWLAALSLAVSCKEDTLSPEEVAAQADKERIEKLIKADPDYNIKLDVLKDWSKGGVGFVPYYYWHEQVAERNSKLKAYEYPSIYAWFDALLYSPTDRWSWMEDKASYVASETGSSGGYGTWGISVTQPVNVGLTDGKGKEESTDYCVYVSRIFPGSPLERYGVTRGAVMTGVNDLDIPTGFHSDEQIDKYNEYMSKETADFRFRLADGRDTAFTASMSRTLTTDYILKTDIFTDEDFPGLTEPVGYFHYLSFAANFVDSMHAEMAKFKEAGVKKMIVDLRYNGGGDSRASDALMGYLAPAEAIGKAYVTRRHNPTVSENNVTQYIPDLSKEAKSSGNLGLDEVFFIMHRGSASASEMTFNGLRPYLRDKLHHVGGQSYGKPNGMYVFFHPTDDGTYDKVAAGDYSTLNYVFYPICFFNFNSVGDGIPSTAEPGSGFVPEYAVPDDVYHDFGPQEADIKACLNYIVNGTFEVAQDSTVQTKARASSASGIKAIFSEDETNPHYGKYTMPLPKEFRKQ